MENKGIILQRRFFILWEYNWQRCQSDFGVVARLYKLKRWYRGKGM